MIIAAFFLAGLVKGTIGLGLPTVSLALLTLVIGLPQAIALLLVPSFVTNLWQSAVGGHAQTILRRLWPFLLLATVTVGLGAAALTRVDLNLLSALLGVLLTTYAAVNLAGVAFSINQRQEIWVGALAGSVNGMLTGMTGSAVVPGVLFLQALGLPRDMLIQAMGILFTASTVALAVALQGNQLLSIELGILSAAGLLPSLVGMWAGRHIRRAMPEQLFRRVFFVALLVLGLYIIAASLT